MTTHIWEWVEDCWNGNYTDDPKDGLAWLEAEGDDCSQRVVRGGAWNAPPVTLRSSNRNGGTTGFRDRNLGFRLAQDTP